MIMASKDKDYRLITLVTDICPIPLRKYFLDLANSDTSPGAPFTTLDQYMVFRQRDVKTLMNFPQKSIRKDQYDLIYPKADETKWDVTLLSALLLGLFENQMKKGENSLIKVIREKRNKLQHKPGSVVTDDAEFDSDWNDVETATQTLALIVGGTTFENEVTDQIQAVKVNNLPRLGDTLKSWYEDIIIELKNEIKELKETSESSLQILQGVSHKRTISKGAPAKKVLKTVDVRVNKLRDYFRQTIERELPEDFKCQPEEREILRILQENHCVVVTGSENTSYLATVLSAIIRSEKYPLDRCFELKTVDDWNSIDPNETDLVLFTEPFVEQQNECRLHRIFQSMQDSCKMPSKEFRIDVVIVSENSKVNHWKENHDDNEIFKNVVELFMPTDENNPLNLEKRNITDKRHDVGGVFGNMIAQSEVFIQDCKTDGSDNKELMEQARQKFKKHKAIVITGLKGGTSTRFALKLVSSLYSKDECVILTEASDWKQVRLGKVSVIVIDEFAGKYKYNTSFVEAWLNKFDIIYAAVIKGLLNVIVTCASNFFQNVVENFNSHALLNHRLRLPDKACVHVAVKEEPLSPLHEKQGSTNTDDSAQEPEQTDREVILEKNVQGEEQGQQHQLALQQQQQQSLIVKQQQQQSQQKSQQQHLSQQQQQQQHLQQKQTMLQNHKRCIEQGQNRKQPAQQKMLNPVVHSGNQQQQQVLITNKSVWQPGPQQTGQNILIQQGQNKPVGIKQQCLINNIDSALEEIVNQKLLQTQKEINEYENKMVALGLQSHISTQVISTQSDFNSQQDLEILKNFDNLASISAETPACQLDSGCKIHKNLTPPQGSRTQRKVDNYFPGSNGGYQVNTNQIIDEDVQGHHKTHVITKSGRGQSQISHPQQRAPIKESVMQLPVQGNQTTFASYQSLVQVETVATYQAQNQSIVKNNQTMQKINKHNVILEGGGQFEEGQAYVIRDRYGNARTLLFQNGEFNRF